MSQDVGLTQLILVILHTFIKIIFTHPHNILIFLSEKETYRIDWELESFPKQNIHLP